MEKHSKDYHDYVFRDGKLIGDFESMYKNSSIIPWRQDETAYSWYNDSFLTLLDEYAPFKNGIEIGCGIGFFTKRLQKFGNFCGVDVSTTAIKKAIELHQSIEFFEYDITSEMNDSRYQEKFDIVVLKDIIWYIFEKIDRVMANIEKLFGSGKYLYIIQSFPRQDKEFIGKEVFSEPSDLVRYIVEKDFDILRTIKIRIYENKEDGEMVAILAKRRKNSDIRTNSSKRR